MPELTLQARALQLAERIDLKGLEREDQLSSNPLAFGLGPHGMVVLFRFGAVVFIGLNPLQEEEIIASLKGRLIEPLPVREEESVTILVKPEADDSIVAGNVELKNTAPERDRQSTRLN